jgi:hypothetical protein
MPTYIVEHKRPTTEDPKHDWIVKDAAIFHTEKYSTKIVAIGSFFVHVDDVDKYFEPYTKSK